MKNEIKLSPNHWSVETFKQRMTIKEWRSILLQELDTIAFKGESRSLVGKNIGCGVIEVSKKPLRVVK